jgi:hypothetical protein
MDMAAAPSPRRSKGAESNSWSNAAGELEIDVTQQAWAQFTGLSAAELKQWVKQTILPDLPVFFEWRRATKDSDNQSPSRDEVKETMAKDFAVISRDTEDFVQTSGLNNRQIWAHTVIRIKGHLISNAHFAKKFEDTSALNNAAFDFLKFVVRNLSPTRCFHLDKTPEAEAARAYLVSRKICQRIHRIQLMKWK